jgi:hypothetical protein
VLKLFASGLVVLLFPLSAAAQSVGGSYTVAGTGPDGSAYTGAAEITIDGADCRLMMAFGNGEVSGSCLQGDGVLATSDVAGGALTLVLYRVQPDGVLNGIWSVSGMAGTGTEVLTPK